MNEQSHMQRELGIIPPIARVLAGVVFLAVEVGLLAVLPRHAKDLPPMPAWVLISLLGGFILAVYVLLVGYVNADARRRGMSPLLWTLLVIFISNGLGFIAYFLLRKPIQTPCPSCGTQVSPDFRFCPKCGYAVTPTCVHCGGTLKRDYVVCPYCGKGVGTTVA